MACSKIIEIDLDDSSYLPIPGSENNGEIPFLKLNELNQLNFWLRQKPTPGSYLRLFVVSSRGERFLLCEPGGEEKFVLEKELEGFDHHQTGDWLFSIIARENENNCGLEGIIVVQLVVENVCLSEGFVDLLRFVFE